MKAKKENKVYSITTDQEKQRYLKAGYDIYADDGELLEHSPQKKISYGQYEALLKEHHALEQEMLTLCSENEILRKENEALREENGSLPVGQETAGTGTGDAVPDGTGARQEKKEPRASGKKAGV